MIIGYLLTVPTVNAVTLARRPARR